MGGPPMNIRLIPTTPRPSQSPYSRADRVKDAVVGVVAYGALGTLLFVVIPAAHWWSCYIR